jgi:alpha-ribazole phosphatase
MITYKLHILRTGSTGAGEDRRFVGQLDLPLSERGVDELVALKNNFTYPRAEIVLASPLLRCVETAELLYPDTYLETMGDFSDLGLGDFEVKGFDQLQGDPAFQAWLQNSRENPPPGGEEIEDFQKRIIRGAMSVFSRMMEEKFRDVVLITHGGVIMSLLAGIALPKRAMGEWAAENGAGYTVLYTPQMWMRDHCVEAYSRQPV